MSRDRDYCDVFSDGGVVSKNPSTAGTWACIVVGGSIVIKRSGVVTCQSEKMMHITNNYSELYAAMSGIEAAQQLSGDGRKVMVTLYTDSAVTKFRIEGRGTTKGMTRDTVLRLRRVRKFVQDVILLSGHPTKADLECGSSRRTGRPVHRYNVECDEMCRQECIRYVEEYGGGK